MRAAEGFGNNVVDELEFEKMFGSNFEGFGGFRGGSAIFPENRSTTFGADDRIIGVFENQDAVGDANAKCAARATFADNGSDNGNLEQHHFPEIYRDCFGNVALFSSNSRVCPGCIY
jgi:hypothetical protein